MFFLFKILIIIPIILINNINLSYKISLNNDLKRLSLLSKLIYDYDYIHKHKEKKDLKFNIEKDNYIDITNKRFHIKNNIYFNLKQFITKLNNNDFIKDSDKYFDLLNIYFPNIQIYGYFYNKKRLHSLILLNNDNKEIIVVFRGSQYKDEWCKNLKIFEKEIKFDNLKNTFHNGILNMYTDDNIDNNIIYILEKLFNYYPNYRKIFTGHSRGSINSILLSMELFNKLDKKYNYEIFGFGTPPLFNYKLALYLHNHPNIIINNIINELDIVTLLPYKYHIGKEIILKDKIIINNHKLPYKISNKINIKNIPISIINHDLNIYIKKIFNEN